MEITTAMIKELRQATGAGVLDCREALESCDGDFESAVTHLREKGLAAAAKRAGRQVSDGLVEAYVHTGGRVAVLLELNCATDFVARTDDFKTLAHDLALHIAFAAPRYFSREDVPEEVIESERAIYRVQALEEGKPEHIVDRIVEGRLEKFYQQVCLMEQPFVRDEDRTVESLIADAIAKLGENVVLRRFVRYEVGEEINQASDSYKEYEMVSGLLALWDFKKPDRNTVNQLMDFCETASFENVLRVWKQASLHMNDPERRRLAEEDNHEAIDIIAEANALRVHILQKRKDIKHRLPRDDNYRMPPGI